MALKYKVLIGIVLFGALVVTPAVTFLAMCSTDEPPHDDSDLRLTLPEVPDHLNAYPLLDEAGEKVYWAELDPASKDRLEQMLEDGPWDAALARQVLDRNREAFALFEKAMARPHFQFPRWGFADDKPGLYLCHALLNVLSVRCAQELAEGSPESALETAITQVRFGDRLERAKGPLVGYLIGMTVRQMGYVRIRRVAVQAQLPPAAWLHCADRLAALTPAPEALADAIRVDYEMGVEVIDAIRSGEYDPNDFGHYGVIPFLPYALHVNRTKHLLADAARTCIDASGQPYCDAVPVIQAWENKVRTTRSASWLPDEWRPNALGWGVCYGLSSDPEWLTERRCHVAVSGAVTQALLALKAYKTQEGHLPETLDDLVPEYLRAVPLDAFDGKPIRYDPAKRILYSVGKDGADGGGLSKEEQQQWWKREFPDQAEEDPTPDVSRMPDPSYTIDF